MKKTLKTWTAIGAAMATSTAAVAASPATRMDMPALAASAQPVILAAGGGEGEGAVLHEDPDVEYFYDLGIIEGHLTTGLALYTSGDAAMAKMHMKHPKDDIYEELEHAMKERGVKGFADELSAFSAAVEGGAPADEVKAKYDAVLAAIDASGTPESAADRAKAIVKLARKASDEYADGVIDRKVTDAHDFQDAYGYIQAAKRLLKRAPESEKSKYADEFTEIESQLSGLDKAWTDLSGKSPVDVDPTELAGAAARIELTALGMN